MVWNKLKEVVPSLKLCETLYQCHLIKSSLLIVVFSLQMIARGKNASDLFPAVVKNVACKNIEVCTEPSVMLLFFSLCGFTWFTALRLFLFGLLVIYAWSYHILKVQRGLALSHLSKIAIFPLFFWGFLSLTLLLHFRFISVKIIEVIHIIWNSIFFFIGMFCSHCSSLQVKKLVYVYLVRYAEEQQDLALLSISTFQRGLKVQHLLWVSIPSDSDLSDNKKTNIYQNRGSNVMIKIWK